MISLIFDKNIFKIMTIFSISPGSRFKRNEFKEKTRFNNIILDNSLSRLVNSGLLNKEKKLYSINLENLFIKNILSIILKQYISLREIPLDVYFLLMDFISSIKIKKTEIYLFGSYSKLVYKENSDIDIAILDESIDKKSVSDSINKLEKKYKKRIEIHYFDKNQFYKNKSDPLIKDIIKNGIKLI